jgi:1,4-alpha-glucan branching enzyme
LIQGIGTCGLKTAETAIKLKPVLESASAKISPPSRFQPVSERFPALEEHEVVLTCFAPGAREVNVAGNFNGWRPEATPLSNTGAGRWAVRLMLRSGEYEYRFAVDGRWTENPPEFQGVVNSPRDCNYVFKVPLEVMTSG